MKQFFWVLWKRISIAAQRVWHTLLGQKLTDKGHEMLVYLSEVIMEGRQPVSMTDYSFEETFNPGKLEDKERIMRAAACYMELRKYG